MEESKSRPRLEEIVFAAIDVANELIDPGSAPIPKTPDTIILGPGGSLDSMGFVNFSAAIEDKIEEEFGVNVSLSDTLAEGNAAVTVDDVLLRLQKIIGER